MGTTLGDMDGEHILDALDIVTEQYDINIPREILNHILRTTEEMHTMAEDEDKDYDTFRSENDYIDIGGIDIDTLVKMMKKHYLSDKYADIITAAINDVPIDVNNIDESLMLFYRDMIIAFDAYKSYLALGGSNGFADRWPN
jgi:hypothetical protein